MRNLQATRCTPPWFRELGLRPWEYGWNRDTYVVGLLTRAAGGGLEHRGASLHFICGALMRIRSISAVSALSVLPPNQELPLREIASCRSASVPETGSSPLLGDLGRSIGM